MFSHLYSNAGILLIFILLSVKIYHRLPLTVNKTNMALLASLFGSGYFSNKNQMPRLFVRSNHQYLMIQDEDEDYFQQLPDFVLLIDNYFFRNTFLSVANHHYAVALSLTIFLESSPINQHNSSIIIASMIRMSHMEIFNHCYYPATFRDLCSRYIINYYFADTFIQLIGMGCDVIRVDSIFHVIIEHKQNCQQLYNDCSALCDGLSLQLSIQSLDFNNKLITIYIFAKFRSKIPMQRQQGSPKHNNHNAKGQMLKAQQQQKQYQQFVDSQDDFLEENQSMETSFMSLTRQQLSHQHLDEAKKQHSQDKGNTSLRSIQQVKLQQNHTLYENIEMHLQMMFIIFSSYKDDLIIIGSEHSCRIKILTNKVRVSITFPKLESQNQNIFQNKLNSCVKSLKKFLDKINYIQFKNADQRHRFYNSPYLQQRARKQYQFLMAKFNNKVLCYSNEISEDQIKNRARELFGKKYVFSINFRSPRFKLQDVHLSIIDYFKKIIEYEKPDSQKRQVVVEISRNQCCINCIGSNERNVLASKNSMKNVLQSTNVIIIKYDNSIETSQGQIFKIQNYVENISAFPILGQKIHRKSLVFISKDNILKSLFMKDKFIKLLELNNQHKKCEISMYFLRLTSFSQKKDCVQKICHKKGYDLMTLGGIYHTFKKIFMSEDEEVVDNTQIIQLLINSLVALRDIKKKWDVPTLRKNRPTNLNRFQNDALQGEYTSTGQTVSFQELSNLLGRDVMLEKVVMGQIELVKYRVCEAAEIPVYWYTLSKAQQQQLSSKQIRQFKQKFECDTAAMNQGPSNNKEVRQYFIGKRKISGGQKLYYIQGKIIII